MVILLPCYFEELLHAPRNREFKRLPECIYDEELGVVKPDYHDHIRQDDGLRIGWDTVIHYRFELQASSLMLATNVFGDFSKCCIVSGCMDEKMLKDIGNECREVRLRFIHQPQTARCLVFLLMLRKVSQRIVLQYQDAIDAVGHTLTRDVGTIFNFQSISDVLLAPIRSRNQGMDGR
jgi:hypothetical protein